MYPLMKLHTKLVLKWRNFIHAISKCYRVSETYGLGKLRAFNKLNESTWTDISEIFGNEDADLESVTELRKNIFVGLRG